MMIDMWSDEKIHEFRETLLSWYDADGRATLPWRQDTSPYRVWVSEIMLQQTQVNTVIPYFERFMTRFPTVQSLAEAPEADLLKVWEGLGYYSRVRNMQKAAQQVVGDFQGEWPKTMKELQTLKGIGPYTAAAIASIAFKEPVAAIDGNAFRVFSRLFKIDSDIAQPATRKEFFELGNKIIDPVRPGDFNQAIMDLGSSFMTAKNYDSENSPVKAFNAAYLDGTEAYYPVKSKAKKAKRVNYAAILVQNDDDYLWEKRPEDGMLANFWTVPLVNIDEFIDDADVQWTNDEIKIALEGYLLKNYGISASLSMVEIKPITHVYTHQKWYVSVFSVIISSDTPLKQGNWRNFETLMQDPQPKIQEKIWKAMRIK